MTGWTVRRWARFGHDQLYAATPGGTDLGYLDVKTGRFHTDDMSNLPLLRAAIGDHLGGPAGPGVAQARTERDWHDLADVRAGAAARERAVAEREAQGAVRHLFARLVDARTDERAGRLGADGEEAVAGQLARAGTDWRVLHAVRVGSRGADIDQARSVCAQQPPRGHARVATARGEGGIPGPGPGHRRDRGGGRSSGAHGQGARRAIGRYLRSLPRRLGLRELDAIHEVARRSDTWQG